MNFHIASLMVLGAASVAQSAVEPRKVVAESRYLHLPVKNGAPVRKVIVAVEGRPEREFTIELAEEKPDWWAFLDISAWRGKTLEIRAEGLPDGSKAIEQIDQGDEIKGSETIYREPLRPQVHFSARRGWLNDPNGLVFADGEYHLFFQHNPYGTKWGNMHWGHAVSRDLLHWDELPEALYPDNFGPMFSGSAVVDRGNTTGLGGGKPNLLVLAYTAMGNPSVQCLAVGEAGNRRFEKFSGNPALKNVTEDNRDPKVFWHGPTKRWIMALYAGVPEPGRPKPIETIQFFGSSDLKEWTFLSRNEGYFECPDFFELPIDGDLSRKKWVLSDASGGYQLGTFDGRSFKPETPKLPGHFGRGFYAAQTFNDIPESDGRRIQIGWGQMESPGMPFNQMMLFPTELTLKSTPDGPRLARAPIREIRTLRGDSALGEVSPAPAGSGKARGSAGGALEITAEIAPDDGAEVVLEIRGVPIRYDSKTSRLHVLGHEVPSARGAGPLRLTVLVDRTSIEIFVGDGVIYAPFPVLFKAEEREIRLSTTAGSASSLKLGISELRSIWERGK